MLGLLLIFSASNFLLGTLGILLIPLALSVTTASVLGSVMSIGGFSMMVGSLLMSIWGGPKRRAYGVLGFMLVQGLAVVIGGLRPSIPLFFSAAMIFFFASPIVNACSQAIWQSKVPPDMQGRALAASGMISTAALELGYLSAGPLADRVFEPLMAAGGPLAGSVGQIIGTGSGRGIGLMFIISGALCILVTLVGFLNPRIRLLDTEVPDVEIGGVVLTTETQAMRLRSAGDASLLS
jgi:DHA3 family macrolide efflux protein-like MFS transporter